MRTFFARRYMRPLRWVGTTEKVIGAAILLLLVAILAVFVVHVRGNKDFLFEVDDAAEPGGNTAREFAIAHQMLPPPADLGLPGGGEVTVALIDELATALGDDHPAFHDFDAAWIAERVYHVGAAPPQPVKVRVCDMKTPAQAMGICRARRPGGTAALPIGHDGWVTSDAARAGFWNGRYYTEVIPLEERPDSMGRLVTIARAIADLQLDYGSPLPAEAALPRADRVADSLRYFHRRAFGIDVLHEVLAVDLHDGTVAWVTDAGDMETAQALFTELETFADASTPSAGEYGGPSEAANGGTSRRGDGWVAFPSSGRALAFSTSGRYVRGILTDEADALSAAKRAYPQVESTAAPAVADRAERDRASDSPFPPPGIPDWRRPQEVQRFTPDTLYEKINGRADAYLQFHVAELIFGTYAHGSDARRSIDVYRYDMGEPINAFGIFRAEAPPEATPLEIGAESYSVGGAVFFRKGASYVQVLPVDPSDVDATLGVARRVAARIAEAEDDLWARSILPQAGRRSGTFAFIAQDAFDLGFLHDVFTAEYDVQGARVTLFVHRAANAAAATDLLEEYIAFFEKYGRLHGKGEDSARTIVVGELSGMFDAVFAHGRYLGGAAGADDGFLARKAAEDFLDELTTSPSD